MPLVASKLSAEIVNNFGKLGSDSPECNAQYDEGTKKIADAIAEAVVKVLQSDAEVLIPPGAIQVATTGSPAAQTGANTAPAQGSIL